jgi:hypothetical protein
LDGPWVGEELVGVESALAAGAVVGVVVGALGLTQVVGGGDWVTGTLTGTVGSPPSLETWASVEPHEASSAVPHRKRPAS